ncbi:MAG TPA: hypothetical protein VHE34_08860 [Puia sp.]|uniref:hypothetical protein n=1 Tax=Puia sp. TaxID=2045100 RepID=UPI002C7C3F4D|nr:hypothetical protein [Puia sp.]HVU95321.1 hypothetical protein [Puia sp.]
MLNFAVKRALPVVWGVIALSLSSCLGPHKVNKWVAQHYSEEPPLSQRKKTESIVVSSALPETGVNLSQTRKNTSHLLPLLFYWQFDYRNTCTLNPQIAIDNFTSTLLAYASHGLKQKLNGNRLELTVEQIPQVFVVDDKGHIIWVIVTMVGWERLSVQPEQKDMVIGYRLLGANNEELKKGSITIADQEKTLTLGMFKSLRNLTKQHLSEYDANISAMTRHFVDRLITEL